MGAVTAADTDDRGEDTTVVRVWAVRVREQLAARREQRLIDAAVAESRLELMRAPCS